MTTRQFHIICAFALALPIAVMAGPAVSLASESISALAGQKYDEQIYSFLSNQCLQPAGGSTAQGAPIVQEPCTNTTAQQWTKTVVKGGIVHYVNVNSGLCLDARGSAANHTPVQQWPCNQITNENWEAGSDYNDSIPPLYSRISGSDSFCLDIPGGQTIVGLAMQIYHCNGTESQDWWVP